MTSDLIKMRLLLQGATLSDAEVEILRLCVDGICRDARLSVRRIGRYFALLCETFATVYPEQLPPELRAEIEAIVLGRDLPEPDTSGPVTPMDLLQIATRLAAMGDRADAARLRRLADDLVAKPNVTEAIPAHQDERWLGIDHARGPYVTATMVAVGLDDGSTVFASIEQMVRDCIPCAVDDQLRIARTIKRYLAEFPSRRIISKAGAASEVVPRGDA
jgi:hypothetical protein